MYSYYLDKDRALDIVDIKQERGDPWYRMPSAALVERLRRGDHLIANETEGVFWRGNQALVHDLDDIILVSLSYIALLSHSVFS